MGDSAPRGSDCVEFLSLLTEPKRRRVLAGSVPVRHSAGTLAYMPEQQDYAAIIERGLARVYVGDTDGRQATAFYIHRGELLSRGLMMRPALSLCVQAVTDVEITKLDVERLRKLAHSDVQVALALCSYYVSLLAHATRIIAVRSLGNITERLAFDLLDRACHHQVRSRQLLVRVSQQQLADSIGSAREVVARSLHRLRDERIVATRTNLVRVLDVERLEAIATQGSR